MAMVLPVTSSSVKKTTEPMARIRNSMLPICFTKAAAKAVSVWVRVSQGELANSASIAFATRSASSGFATRTTYQPDDALASTRALLVEVLVLEPELRLVVLGRVPR